MQKRRLSRAEREHRNRQMDWHYEEKRIEWAKQELSWRATIDFAHSAIKGALLLNGAAAIALMAFLGSAAAKEREVYGWAACSLLLFAIGTFFAVISGGVAYFAQKRYTEAADLAPSGRMAQMFANDAKPLVEQWEKNAADAGSKYQVGDQIAVGGVVAYGFSILAFLAGSIVAYCGFTALGT